MEHLKYFITGIGTNIGKTVFSAILTENLKADYWKPIQSGDLETSDSRFIAQHISNLKTTIHPETYQFKNPLSPHAAAKLENKIIDIDKFILPPTDNHLIVEGAGGLFVPINDQYFIIDLIKKLDLPVILVSQNYLGSINHTLLSIKALNMYNITIAGLIFNGEPNPETERIILEHVNIPIIKNINTLAELSKSEILRASHLLNWES